MDFVLLGMHRSQAAFCLKPTHDGHAGGMLVTQSIAKGRLIKLVACHDLNFRQKDNWFSPDPDFVVALLGSFECRFQQI